MKRLVKSKITKHILGIMFVVAAMFASLQMNIKTASALTQRDFSEFEISNPQFYDSKCLKSFDVSIQTWHTYTNPAYGKIGIHNGTSAFNDANPAIDKDNADSWPAVNEICSVDQTLVTISTGEEFEWTDKEVHSVTVVFDDGKIDCTNDATYYVYLWSRSTKYGIYPDCLFDTKLKISNGKLYASDSNGDHEIKQPDEEVVDKINAIGNVEYTDECKSKIDDARAAYDALTNEQKAKITESQYKKLTDAEEEYNNYKVADVVIAKINAIGTVENTEECKDKIDDARAAYDALTNEQKAKITESQYKKLTDAEEEYNNYKAADVVIAKINEIGTVENTEECKAKIDAAREAYDALTDTQKTKITDTQYKKLTDAEEEYNAKVVDAVIEKINAIGTVENTEECKVKIDVAREAYDALTDTQKIKITDTQYKKLTDAEEEYNAKVVDAVIEKINAIGTVENTEECKAKIDAAREAYNKLTDILKTKINAEQYKKLTEAEIQYDGFKNHGKYEDVKPSLGTVTDITGTDKAPAETNPFSAAIKNETKLEEKFGIVPAEKAQGVNVWLELVDASVSMTDSDKEKINNIKGNQIVGLYLDISVYKKVGSNNKERVHELNDKIQVSMIIPESLRKSGRTYSLVRVHNGVAQNIGGTYDASTYTFTFETDKFSSYAILYKDSTSGGNASGDNDNGSGSNESAGIGNGSGSTAISNNTSGNTASQVTAPTSPSPKTGDTNALVLWIALAFAALLSGTTVAIKLNNN